MTVIEASARRWIVASYPRGIPAEQDFRLEEARVAPPADGQITVRALYLSMEPLPRLRLDPASRMGPPLPLGSVMPGRGAGTVVASRHPGFREGDLVSGELGWQELTVLEPTALTRWPADTPPAATLHLLGASGLTAWFVLHAAAEARAGDEMVVSAAAGSVGLALGQLAAEAGAKPIGIVKGARQQRFVDGRFGYSAAVDCDLPQLAERLRLACPHGVDVFADSVGGPVHDAVLSCVNAHARVILFGFISAYNAPAEREPTYGRIYDVIRKRVRMSGFLLGDFAPRFDEARRELASRIREGRLTMPEVVTDGFENVPRAFGALFGAAEPGKHLVRL